MIHPPAHLPLEPIRDAVIEEAELPALLHMPPEHILHSPLHHEVQRFLLIRVEADLTPQRLGVIHIPVIPGHVQVTHPHHRLVGLPAPIQFAPQRAQPVELVSELFRPHRLPLGDVRIDDPNVSHPRRNEPRIIRMTAVAEP